MKIPTEVNLFWVATNGSGFFSLQETNGMNGYHGYTWLGVAQVDFGDLVFDEKALKLKALNAQLGEAQGKVNWIKEEIQKLQAIGHDDTPEIFDTLVGAGPSFGPQDDITEYGDGNPEGKDTFF